jgi:DNA-binding XRE family transcriptional regulator
MAIKNRLKVILAEKNISQNELAEGVGLSKSALSNIVSGRQNATLESAMDIARFLGEPIEKIFYKEKSRDEIKIILQDLLYRSDVLYNSYVNIQEEDVKTKTSDDLKRFFKIMILEFNKSFGVSMLSDLLNEETRLRDRINPLIREVIDEIKNDADIMN